MIVAAGLGKIVEKRLGSLVAMAAKDLNTDHLSQEARGDMVGRAAEKAAGEFRPLGHRSSPLYQFGMAPRQLPAAMDAGVAAARWRRKGQAFDILRPRLVIIERSGRLCGVAERWMCGDVLDSFPVDVDLPAVAQAREVVGPGLDVPVFGHRRRSHSP